MILELMTWAGQRPPATWSSAPDLAGDVVGVLRATRSLEGGGVGAIEIVARAHAGEISAPPASVADEGTVVLYEVVGDPAWPHSSPAGVVLDVILGVVSPNAEASSLAAIRISQAEALEAGGALLAVTARRLVGRRMEVLVARLGTAPDEPLAMVSGLDEPRAARYAVVP